MARFTADILKTTGAQSLPDPTLGSNAQTQGQWGLDINALLLIMDGDFGLTYAGNPNGHVAANYVGRKCYDTVRRKIWAATATGTSSTAVWVDTTFASSIDVRDYLAIPDALAVYDIVCTSGSPTATSATAAFTNAINGKKIKIYNINTSTLVYQGTATYSSATTITLGGNALASCASGDAIAYWGTDNLTAIQNAINAADALVPQNINGPNFPVGSGYARVIFPVTSDGGGYLIGDGTTAGLTVGRNVIIDADAMIFSNIGGGASDRKWLMKGTGFHITKLLAELGGGMGIDMGTININSSSVILDMQLWNVGNNYNANYFVESATRNAGGTGYAVNDTITLTGGTGTQAVLKVTAVASGVPTAVTIQTIGNYSVQPTNPVSQGSTSGSGTGATWNLVWSPNGQIGFRITGYDFTFIGRYWIKGANIGFHANQASDVFVGTPLELIGCSTSFQGTSMENGTINFVCDTGSFLACALDGCRNSRVVGRGFSVTTTVLTYGVQMGEYDPTNLNRGIHVEYVGQRQGGNGVKISNSEDCRLDLVLTNAALFSASGGNMTTAVTYGSGNVGSILVNCTRDGAIAASSGTVVGILNDFADGVMTSYGPSATGSKKTIVIATANTTFTIPANHYIQAIIVNNTTANAVTSGIKIGTTSGATDIVASFAVAANLKSYIPDATFAKKFFSTSVDQTCFLQTIGAWNSASVTFTIIFGNL